MRLPKGLLICILAITLLLMQVGCTEAQPPSDHVKVRQSWEKSTRIESALDEPGYPVVVRYSRAWTLKKSGQEDGGMNIQGMVALTYHKDRIDIARGIYFFISPSKDPSTFGDAYVDLDELPDLIAAMDRFSNHNATLELREDAMVGMSFKTKGMLHFRMGSFGPGFVIGARKTSARGEETSISSLTKEDLAEFKMKLELAKQWAEKQAP
jgi:hypothetical protein